MAATSGRVSREEILHISGRSKDNRLREFPLDAALEANLTKLLVAVNEIRKAYGKPMVVSSGYRPGPYNRNGAPGSLHKTCRAVDFFDPTGEIKAFCMANVPLLKKLGLQLEHPLDTGGYKGGWCHLDIGTRPNTVFRAK